MHVDLNLILALDALLEENSVQGAADRLRLSAPAMSRTLGRIRRATGDDILVRSGRTMTPTPRALEIRGETAELVRRATVLLSPQANVDLTRVRRVFAVRCHDALLTTVAPSLLDSVAEHMPLATVRFIAESSTDGHDLQRGHIDLDVGSSASPAPEISSSPAGSDRLVAAMRPENPVADAGLTADTFATAHHVIVSRRGRTRDAIDDVLSALGVERQVLATVPTSAAALEIVAHSDALVVVAQKTCAVDMQRVGVTWRPLPFDLAPVPAVILWHRRHDSDPAHAWLRTRVGAILGSALA